MWPGLMIKGDYGSSRFEILGHIWLLGERRKMGKAKQETEEQQLR